MIPLGPWLALGFLIALGWNQPAHDVVEGYVDNIQIAWAEQPQLLLVAGGLMLVGTAAALVFARLLRRWVAPDSC